MELGQLNRSANSGLEKLVQLLWSERAPNERLVNGDLTSQLHHSAYLEYYQRQWDLTAGNCDGKYVALKAPEDVNRLVQTLGENMPYRDLIRDMQDTWGGNEVQEAYENSLDLAARLLLMLRIGKVTNQFLHRRCLLWKDGSLRDFVASYFAEAPKMNTHDVKLPKSFNGWSLESIGGIQIIFTDNLADHLLLTDDDSKVFVFSYVSFLECHRLDGDKSLLPSGLAEETLRTLALLFPQSIINGSARSGTSRHSWFRRLCNQEDRTTDERLGKCGNLHAEDRQIENFAFWRDRVIILKQAYDEATPSNLSQFWYDRRNGVQWYTFWAAILVLILTFMFGVLGSIQGGYEAWG